MEVSADGDHNRAVIAFFGTAETVAEAVLSAAREAVCRIDLRTHKGAHPRFGAIDVIPFVPLAGAPMEEAIALSKTAGERLAAELELPVYLYENSAADEARRNLATIRRIGHLGPPALLIGDVGPDFGPSRFHPTAGASAVGARGPLVAYNVNLATADPHIAHRIAAKIRGLRESGEGMAGVKALGMLLAGRSAAQVSTNVTLPDVCCPREVFDFVQAEAAEAGVGVLESELIGVVSRRHLPAHDAAAMRFSHLKQTQFIEHWTDGRGY